MKLNTIQSTAGSRRERKRLGAGIGTGQGKTAGRGHKGQKSRTGGKVRRGFEGGQMPLMRRLPKRGFTSKKEDMQIINVGQLEGFEAGSTVDAAALYEAGLIRSAAEPVKLLAGGELTKKKITLAVTAASAAAKAKIEAAGATLKLAGEA
ncbi:MAG TPA: 50S ribosomal protein L15 [Mariprofundaceae bacterium]|nr:50S ribosomal protein L15 [Mariprofundaceae bacterium]